MCPSIRLGLAMALLAMQFTKLTLKLKCLIYIIANIKSFIIKSETNSYIPMYNIVTLACTNITLHTLSMMYTFHILHMTSSIFDMSKHLLWNANAFVSAYTFAYIKEISQWEKVWTKLIQIGYNTKWAWWLESTIIKHCVKSS